jgi:hypothetical protein
MYHELGEFMWHMGRRQKLWKDGELWTALILGGLAGWLFYWEPSTVDVVRDRFGELLTVASIVFGFVLTTLFFYIQAASEWSRDPRVGRVAEKLVDWHVWTVMCLLVLVGLIVVLWVAKSFFTAGLLRSAISHALLVFLAAYCSFQIINHVLTVRWVFRTRSVLTDGPGVSKHRTGDAEAAHSSDTEVE